MRKPSLLLGAAAFLISGGIASAQSQTPSQYDKSGAPTGAQSGTPERPPVVTLPQANEPETTGQTPKFEDRWPGQAAVPYLPPAATAPETTGQAQTNDLPASKTLRVSPD